MKAPNDPDRVPLTKQNRNGKYLPSTFRFSPEDLQKLDDLVAEWEDRIGQPTTRSEFLRAYIRREWSARCRTPPRSKPKPAAPNPPPPIN